MEHAQNHAWREFFGRTNVRSIWVRKNTLLLLLQSYFLCTQMMVCTNKNKGQKVEQMGSPYVHP